MTAFVRLALVALMLLAMFGYAEQVHASGLVPPAEQNRLLSQLENRPMVFFLAKGAANSCGPGCDEWIAAEGRFVQGTAQRFRDFLATVTGQNLPIYFHSRGGISVDALRIGRILRERRMTAGVGRTMAQRCRIFSLDDSDCQRLIGSGHEVKARLISSEGQCHSACVYAFAGASERRIPSGSILSVHSARIDVKLRDATGGKEIKVGDLHRHLQRYLIEMGVDPQLEDISVKVSPRRIYILSREEIARFGIETRGFYETSWMSFLDSSKRPFVHKSITQAMGPDGKEYLTSGARLWCFNGSIWFVYRRELPSDGAGIAGFVRVVAGDNELKLQHGQKKDSSEFRMVSADSQFIQTSMTAPSIVITEDVTPTGNSQISPRKIRLSTGGLSKQLEKLQKDCGGPKDETGGGVK